MCSFCIRAAGIRRVVFALHSPVLGGLSKWNILADRSLSRRIPCLFRAPPEIAHGVLADEAMQAWSDWRPLTTQAIRLLGFFVKPKVGKIDADGLQPAREGDSTRLIAIQSQLVIRVGSACQAKRRPLAIAAVHREA